MIDLDKKIYTISDLTEEIKDLLEAEFPVIWLEGEISNFKVPPSGHFYFTLKDASSQIRAVFFKSGQYGLSFRPENGLQVLCFGRLSVYAGRGEYQIIIERMEMKGWGALQLAFEQLKERLFREGLFDASRKKPLPLLPRRVAIVTSPTGAVIQDFLRILFRRFSNIQVSVVPVLVQGERASSEIAEAIRCINQSDLGHEVIVLARGGGSIEDLWPFNEERVARAVTASRIPVISAIGHEVDFTITDFVADLRASTPSAAAELLIQPQQEWEGKIEEFQERLSQEMLHKTARLQEEIFHLQKRLGDPRRRLIDLILRIDDYGNRLQSALHRALGKKQDILRWMKEKLFLKNPKEKIISWQHHLDAHKLKLNSLVTKKIDQLDLEMKVQHKTLQALSPWAILDRGYALVQTLPALQLVRKIEEAPVGQEVRVLLARGELDCLVKTVRRKEEKDLVEGTV
jgi:exodeoxyribonuclease VII large subunit